MLMDTRTESLARRGRKLRREGSTRKAVNAYGELTSIEPEHAPWWVLLGVCQRDLGRHEEARKCFRQALYLLRQQDDDGRAAPVLRLLEELEESASGMAFRGYRTQSSVR